MAHQPDTPPVPFAFVLTAVCIIGTLFVGILGLAAYRAVTLDLEAQHAKRQAPPEKPPVYGLEEAKASILQEAAGS